MAGKNLQVVAKPGSGHADRRHIAHSDHHAIWIDPKNGKHIMIGNDGGLDVTYDQG